MSIIAEVTILFVATSGMSNNLSPGFRRLLKNYCRGPLANARGSVSAAKSALPFRAATVRERTNGVFQQPARDYHETFLGALPGYVLHANYIESLLDGRYLKPVVHLAYYKLFWFVAIELLLHFVRPLWKALLYAIVGSSLLAVLIYLAVFQFGYYLDLLPFGVIVIVIGWSRRRLALLPRWRSDT